MDEPNERRPPKKKRSGGPGPAPTRASLHEAALAYLARGAATADSVSKTLQRRIANWARRAARSGRERELLEHDVDAARALIPEIVARLREVGLVNDAAFAETRARRLERSGRSRRAISAHLAQKGVDAAIVREALPRDAGAELAAALAFARKRRIGPFARDESERDDRDAHRKSLGAMARAGFGYDVCERALRMDREAAEDRIRERDTF